MTTKEEKLVSLNGENWKEIPGLPGYSVSDMGRVLSHEKTWIARGLCIRPARILKPSHRKKYLHISIRDKDRCICSFMVHRLVVMVWRGEIPDGMQVNHINGDAEDNRLHNLEVCSPSQNMLHAYRNELKKASKGSEHGVSKINEADAIEIFNHAGSNAEMARKFRISGSTISAIKKKRLWKHIHGSSDRLLREGEWQLTG